MHINRKCAT